MIAVEDWPGVGNEKELYDLLGNKDERKKFDTQFKKAESNFKIAIVVGWTLSSTSARHAH
ncbi:MAG: hypothetical protein ACKVHP_25485 [Verrucomicrobiales bacterium]|jgi:type I restriction enzyme R subunit